MAYQIPREDIETFHQADQLIIPVIDPSDHTFGLDNAGKRPIKGLSFKDALPSVRYPYEQFHNAAWVVRDNVVVDIDPRNGGKEGYAKLCELTGCKLHELSGVTVTTGGGGKHIYFSLPAGFSVGPQKILKKHGVDGIEVKSGNGYVVIPGSKHSSGSMYRWDSKTIASGLVEAPRSLLDLIEKPEVGEALTGGLSVASAASHDMERARVLVAEYEGAGSGERNDTMYRLAARLLDLGLDEASCHEHLATADLKNHPQLGQGEIHDIYKKALRYRRNEFGALSIESDFEEVDTTVLVDGQRLTAEEALAQVSEITGADEAQAAAEELIAVWDNGNGDMAKFDDIVTDRMLKIARASDSVRRRIRRMLTEGGQKKVMGTADFDDWINSTKEQSNEDLSESLAMYVLENKYGGQRLRFSKKAFYVFNPNMWHRIEDQEVQRALLDEINTRRAANPEFKMSSNALMNTATNLMRARTHVRAEDFFPSLDRQPPRVLNCTNGELWIDDDGNVELRESSPASRMFHSLGVAWNPDADCPTYKRVLREVFQHAEEPGEVIRHHLEMKGYHLSPKKPLPVIEVCVGKGANGKSLLNADVMVGITGPESIGLGPISMFKIDTPSTTARLENRLIWIDPDMEANSILPAALLKGLSENTMLTIEPKFQDSYNIMSLCSWTLLANQLPRSRDASRGLQRRIYCFEYGHDFAEAGEADLGLKDKLADEREGIFRLMVEGLVRVVRRGGFDVPNECEELKKEWMSTNNIVGSFIDECCVLDKNAETDTGTLYQAFMNYCLGEGTPQDSIMHRKRFTESVASYSGLLRTRRGTGGARQMVGLRLLPEWGAAADAGVVSNTPHPDQTVPDWLQ